MNGPGSRAAARGILLLALAAPLLLAAGARAEEGGTRSPPSSLAVFDELYARLTTATSGGRLPPDVAKASEEIRFHLQTDLIRNDAEIEVLKLEAVRFSGKRQQEALDALVGAATAREQRLWAAIRQLEQLSGETAAPAAAVEPPDAKTTGTQGFSIQAEPQNLLEDPDP
jgi:hypothetical protein